PRDAAAWSRRRLLHADVSGRAAARSRDGPLQHGLDRHPACAAGHGHVGPAPQARRTGKNGHVDRDARQGALSRATFSHTAHHTFHTLFCRPAQANALHFLPDRSGMTVTRITVSFLAGLLVAGAVHAAETGSVDLPRIGEPADVALSPMEE